MATSNQRFTSYDRSGATGLDYAVNRTYNSGQSRFTQVDPIGMASASPGDPQSLNLFAYVTNNPIDFTDPTGFNLQAPFDPFGIAYYVDGMLTTANHAWGVLNSGGGFVNFESVGGFDVINHYETGWAPDGEHRMTFLTGQSYYFSFVPEQRLDLPKNIRDFIRKHQGQIDRCINFVFGKKADGTLSKVAERMPRQTLKNAPEFNFELTQFQLQGYTSAKHTLGAPGYKEGTNGTVYIAKDIYLGEGGKKMLSTDEVNRTFIHEWGNILSYRYGGNRDWSEFGDPKGIGNVKDPDTGARLEKCVYGNVPF